LRTLLREAALFLYIIVLQQLTVEKYTKYFTSLMGMKYVGGIRMGSSESYR